MLRALPGLRTPEYLAHGLDEDVLEIAVGTGAMVPYLADRTTVIDRLCGVEPDPGTWTRVRTTLAESPVEMALVSGRAEALPYADDAFDYVLECGLF